MGRVGDISLLMQTIHGVPIDRFPCQAFIVQGKPEDGENRVFYLLLIEFHGLLLSLQTKASRVLPGRTAEDGYPQIDWAMLNFRFLEFASHRACRGELE